MPVILLSMMRKIGKLILAMLPEFKNIFDLVMENIALRQQLAVMKRTQPRPKLRTRDRIFWVLVPRFWGKWRDALVIVKPQTLVKWHRKGFKLFWRWKSRSKGVGRPKTDREIRSFIRKMAKANPLWGAPKIHGELLKLGIKIAETTVSSLMLKRKPNSPSQTWRTFLKNHMWNTCSVDFFTVPTATFKVLFVLVILSHSRRRVVHFNVTTNPTAEWTSQQIVEAFPYDKAPKYLLRDRDSIYGAVFRQRVKNMGINEVLISPKSPWQNPYVERVIGSIRREFLDHVIVFKERHLRSILTEYFEYYHQDRTHLGLDKDTPSERPVQEKPPKGKVVALPRVGGLHHRYEWKKAA